ncbi:MAG: hypothetical protein A2018_00160 [Alphaproteobacteria bacterium GWF2_58_20]|nr:MAG: hypothetical protein A2018_00160 [Alphaproteobacteria bacterium GWF2_58_20]
MLNIPYIIEQLSDDDVRWIAAHGRRLALGDQDVIIREFEQTPDMFIVVKGELGVFVRGLGEMARLAPGDVVGEMSFVDPRPPTATVLASRNVVVVAIAKDVLNEKLRTDSGFGSRFYRALAVFLAERLRHTVRNITHGRASLPGQASRQEKKAYDYHLVDDPARRQARFDWILATLDSAPPAAAS